MKNTSTSVEMFGKRKTVLI